MSIEILDRLGELEKLQDFGPGMVALRNDIEKLVRSLESAENSEQKWYNLVQGQDHEIEVLVRDLNELSAVNQNLRTHITSLENRDKSIALTVAHDQLAETKAQLNTALIQVEKLRHAREVVSVEPVIHEYEVNGYKVSEEVAGAVEALMDAIVEEVAAELPEEFKEPEPLLEEIVEHVEDDKFKVSELGAIEQVREQVHALTKDRATVMAKPQHRAALTPEQQGVQAFQDHKLLMHCPYKFAVEQVKYNQWMFGYSEAGLEALHEAENKAKKDD